MVAAHAASREHRLTSGGLVEVEHPVGFVDAMAPTEVALATGTTVGVAGHQVALGADLAARFPLLLAGVVAGSVTSGTARKVVAACVGLDVAACALVEAVLVDRLADLDPARVGVVARRVAHRVAPAAAAAEADRTRRGRTVEVSPGPDGSTTWWALLPAADSAVAWSAVTTLARDYQVADPGLSIDAARADAMVDLLLARVTVTASVTLGIPVLTTADPDQCDPLAPAPDSDDSDPDPSDRGDAAVTEVTEVAAVSDVAPVEWVSDHDSGEVVPVAGLTAASRARVGAVVDSGWFSGEPGWDLAVVMAPVAGGPAVSGCAIPGIGWVQAATVAGICSTFPLQVGRALLETATGTVLETTTHAYTPTTAIRAHVLTRDRTCRMWACTAPARTLDLDHTRPWPSGATTPANLAGLCRRHHRMKQHARWRYTLTPDGTITWHSPTGQRRVTHPDHAHWPPPPPEPEPAGEPRKPTADCYPAVPPF